MNGTMRMASRCRHALPAIRRAGRVETRRCFSATPATQATYGFIGLGQMGYRMAKNLRQKLPETDTLIVNDVNRGTVQKFVDELAGFTVLAAEEPREIAEKASTIITALPEPQHVKAVYTAMLTPSTLPAPPAGTDRLFIDTSTIDPLTSSSVGTLTTSIPQAHFIDAPMSGGTVGAASGTLTFMLGSPASLVPRATDVLSHMGKRILHLGPPTSGLKGKLANNYLLALTNIATCEAMHMGVSWGLDPKSLADMINMSTGRCWPSEVNNPVPGVVDTAPAGSAYEGGFGVALMRKDLRLAAEACHQFGVTVRLGDEAARVYEDVLRDPELAGKDFSVVYRWLGGGGALESVKKP